MNYPKVLVGCPTSFHKEYCLNEYLEGLKNLTYPNFDILLVDNSDNDDYFEKLKEKVPVIKINLQNEILRVKLANSRNILRKKVIEEKYDYFLSLEQDIVPPKDIIERLIGNNKDIISGVYYNYFDSYPPGIKPLLWRTSTQEEFNEILNSNDPIYSQVKHLIKKNNITDIGKIRARFKCEELEEPRLLEIFMAGLGCVLISRKVLEKIEFKGLKERQAFDDVLFFEDARNSNFKLYADTSIKCKHYVTKMNKQGIIQ